MLWLTVFLAQEPNPETPPETPAAEIPAAETPAAETPAAVPEVLEPQPAEPATPPPAAPAYDELLVTATQTTRSAELALDTQIREMGYRRASSRSGRTQYLSPKIWKPRVTVYEAGFVEVRGRRITPMMPVAETAPLSDEALPGVSGVFQSKRGRASQEDLVRAQVSGEVRDWQRAIQAQALLERQLATRNSCVLVWEQELDPASRRQALAELWLNTSEAPEGAVIRGVVLTYVNEVVQESETPFLPEEVERINAAHSFDSPFDPYAP